MVIDERAEAAGDIVHRAGVFNGSGRITGRIETYSTALYLMNEIHVEGKVVAHVSGAKILNNGTVVHFGGQTRDVAYFQAFDCNSPVHLTGDNLFGANVQLQIGSSFNDSKKSGRLELNGHSQLFGSVAEIPANNFVNIGGIGNSGAPAAVTVADQKNVAWFRGRLDGNLSVAVSGESQLGFVGYENTMNGTITADAGKIKLEYLWPKIKSLVCRNGGFIDIGKPSDTNPQGTIINPKATIDIDGTSMIKVPTGLTLTIRRR
jgi:hypothetical protein